MVVGLGVCLSSDSPVVMEERRVGMKAAVVLILLMTSETLLRCHCWSCSMRAGGLLIN